MKTKTRKTVLLFPALLFLLGQPCIGAEAVPADLPPCPPVEKALANYTAMDMLGRLSTSMKTLPQEHPARGRYKNIREQWPLRNNEEAAKELVEWMLAHEEEDGYRRNGLAVIQNLMVVDHTKTVDAYLAGIEAIAVTREVKEDLASALFDMTWDHRVLKVFSNQLLDETLTPEGPQPAEDAPIIRKTWGERAWAAIISKFHRVGIELRVQFPNTPEGRQGLKAWIAGNDALIAGKCLEARQKDTQEGTKYEFHAKTKPVE